MSRKIIKKRPNLDVKALDKSLPFKTLLMQRISFFKDTNENCYCIFDEGCKKDVYDISSSEFSNAVSRFYISVYDDFIETAELNRYIKGLSALAAQAEIKEYTGNRVIQMPDKVVYNLNNGREAVVVSANSVEIVDNRNFHYFFIHTANSKAQVTPDLTAEPKDLIPLLKELFVIYSTDYLLLAVYICSLFISDIQHPIFTAYGDYGSGKTTALRTIMAIIDPSKRDLLYLNKTSPKDFQIALTRNYFTAFDNVTGTVSDSIMDILCQVVTGGMLSFRRLYTNTDEVHISLKRCLAINGTEIIGKRNDLMERSLLIKFQRLAENVSISDSDYSSKLTENMPALLGAIFNTLSKAIDMFTSKKYMLPIKVRMLEWSEWGYCIAESITKGLGNTFCTDYSNNLKKSSNVSVMDNPYVSCVVSFINEEGDWVGSSTAFFEAILNHAAERGYDTKSKCFPSCPTQAWQKMKQYKTNLRLLGISIYEPVNKGSYRELKIIKD